VIGVTKTYRVDGMSNRGNELENREADKLYHKKTSTHLKEKMERIEQ
jgi:hypothetical protein